MATLGDPPQPGEPHSDESMCQRFCERIPWSSVAATILTVGGIIIVVTGIALAGGDVDQLFPNTYIGYAAMSWLYWVRIASYIGVFIMLIIILMLMSMGCMAAGYQNAGTWCSFMKAKTGRMQLAGFLVFTYIVNLAWYIILAGSTLPAVFFYMVDKGVCTSTSFTNSTCLDLRQFGLAPTNIPCTPTEACICGQQLQDICNSSLLVYFFLVFLGSIFVLLGLNQFMMSLAGNYNWLRIRKRRQKLAAGRISRRDGTYDLYASGVQHQQHPPERQDSQNSYTHLRRANLQYDPPSYVTSSNASIPTVSGHVETPTPMTSLSSITPPSPATLTPPAMASPSKTVLSSKPTALQPTAMTSRANAIHVPTLIVTSSANGMPSSNSYSSKISNQTYGYDLPTSSTTSSANGAPSSNRYSSKISNQTYGYDPPISSTTSHVTSSANGAPSSKKYSPKISNQTYGYDAPTSSASKQNNLSHDRQYDRTNYDHNKRYDNYNPAYDENYGLTTYTDQSNSGDYSSYYNYNHGYNNYDNDTTDAGYEMDYLTRYAREEAKLRDRTPVAAGKFYEYEL